MASITGLTAGRMLLIEARAIVGAMLSGDNLILIRNNGETIDAGNVRGPEGDQGPVGSIQASPAGGDLSGNYPNPTIRNALKDAAADTPSLRTLGTGAQQAAPGTSVADTGWVNFTPTAGEAPFASTAVTRARYRKFGPMVHVQIAKASTVDRDVSGNTQGDLPDVNVLGAGSVPSVACPVGVNIVGNLQIGSSNTLGVLTPAGAIVWTGGWGRSYPSGSVFQGDFVFMTTN